jgi:hypothetical protein
MLCLSCALGKGATGRSEFRGGFHSGECLAGGDHHVEQDGKIQDGR